MKIQHAILITLAPLFLASCGSEDDFGQNVRDYLSTLHHERAYVTYNDLNGTVDDVYQTDGQLTAPLEQTVLNAWVLDQDNTNTSTTLATVGAVGMLTQEDSRYYSAVCSLNLGNYLSYNDQFSAYEPLQNVLDVHGLTHYPSGWRGSISAVVLAQVETFGLLYGSWCGNDYFDGVEPHTDIVDPGEYNQSTVTPSFSSEALCSNYSHDVTDCQCLDEMSCETPESIIDAVKSVIDAKGLALVSTVLFANLENYGLSHAYYRFGPSSSTPNVWEYTDQVSHCRVKSDDECNIVTHDMIAFGYIEGGDGDGLLVLRNSWGDQSGDAGNYYMSYDYAENMLLDVYALSAKE